MAYVLTGLLLFCAVPNYACLRAVDFIRVRQFRELVLVTGVYAFTRPVLADEETIRAIGEQIPF